MFKSRPEPSFSDRLLAAQLISDDARNAFLTAALDLEATGDELDVLSQEIGREIERLTELRDAADEDSEKSRQAARNLRALVADPEPELTLF